MADNYMTFNDAVEVLTPYAEKINTIKPESITWAAYQLLTSEQRAAKRYLITDYPSPTGYVNKLSDLEDVSINSQTLSNGQVPVYNSTTEVWENKTILENSLTSTATDVALTAAQGKVLQDTKQAKNLTTPLIINGTQETTVESALGGLNDYGNALADNLAANENVLGAKNLGIPLEDMTYLNLSTSNSSDGSLTVTTNGLACGGVNTNWSSPFILKKGTYQVSFGLDTDETPSLTGFAVILKVYSISYWICTSGDSAASRKITLAADTEVVWGLYCESGTVVATQTVYPMIRPASIIDPTFVPYAETNLQLTRKTSGLSNRNLIDNPWFTVNQRGWTSGLGVYNQYCVDRWKMTYGDVIGTIEVTANGLHITPDTVGDRTTLYQPFESDVYAKLNGKTLTFSALMSDGTIYSGTKTLDTSSDITFFENTKIKLLWVTGYKCFRFDVLDEITIRAVKVEVGTISTLRLDSLPDYTTELLKCQRYFERLKLLGSSNSFGCFGVGYSVTATSMRATLWAKPKRVLPTITFSGSIKTTNGADVTAISPVQQINSGIVVDITTSGVNLTDPLYLINIGNTAYYIDISADL